MELEQKDQEFIASLAIRMVGILFQKRGKTKNPARMLLAISRVDDSRVEEGVLGLKHTWKAAELEKCEQWFTCQKQFM